MSLIPLRRGIGFTVFPPEVREMIFKFALSGTWNGRSPALIQALRVPERDQHRYLYLEALDAFFSTNIFRLHAGNQWRWWPDFPIPPQILPLLETVQIDLGDEEQIEELTRNGLRTLPYWLATNPLIRTRRLIVNLSQPCDKTRTECRRINQKGFVVCKFIVSTLYKIARKREKGVDGAKSPDRRFSISPLQEVYVPIRIR